MVTLRELFSENRLPSGWKLLPILLYLPVGLALVTVRVFIGIQAILAATLLYKLSSVHSVVLRFMCSILGVVVLKENETVEDDSVRVIVSNHVSVLDHLAIHLVRNSFSTDVCELPSLFHQGLNCKDLGGHESQDNFVRNVKTFLNSDVTLDIQPEGGTTSGQKGLLRFSVWPCKLSHPIQPVVIRAWRPPFTDISLSVLNTSWVSDIFWFLFVPFTVFKIRYLPVVRPMEEESPEDMSKRLEKLIADDLKIEVTNFRASDKMELEKRLTAEMNVIKQPPARVALDPTLVEMASKVKEVLPDVPLTVIYKDLGKTRSVDLTISNFLENVIKYTPEKVTPSVPVEVTASVPEARKSSDAAGAGVASASTAAQPSTSFDTSSKTFHKSAQERMLSFQERKLRLIQNARQRYMEKHALNVVSNS